MSVLLPLSDETTLAITSHPEAVSWYVSVAVYKRVNVQIADFPIPAMQSRLSRELEKGGTVSRIAYTSGLLYGSPRGLTGFTDRRGIDRHGVRMLL